MENVSKMMALWMQWLPPWSTLHPGKLDKAFNLVHRPAWVGWYDVLTLILKGYCRKKSIISDSLMGRQNRKVSSGVLNFMPLPRELSLVMVPSYSPDAPVSSTSWYFPVFFFSSLHLFTTLIPHGYENYFYPLQVLEMYALILLNV